MSNADTEKASAYASAARKLPVMAFVWIGLLFVTAIASLCPRFTGYYAVYLLVTLGLAALALVFLDAIYRRGKTASHPAFKKLLGYGLVLHYAAAALPRVDWAGKGLIGPGRVTYLFMLSIVCLVAGIVLFVASGRPEAYAALGLINDEEVRDRALRKKRFAETRKKGLLHGVLEWVDALGFAAILVILIQTFVFQLYEIPSESMVPAFLDKDRPFTSKLNAGPRVPLTDWRLPFLKLPARGDVIVLANPRYPENQSVNLKKYLAQFISMVTFTAVNIDKYLPDGSPKYDPLTKRIVGLPGEKLMMVDDVLYAKRKGEATFTPVEADKAWAHTDLWKESPGVLGKIEYIPVDEEHRKVLDSWDARKREADPGSLASSIAASARVLEERSSTSASATFLKEIERIRPGIYQAVATDIAAFEKADFASGNPIAQAGTSADDLALALAVGDSAKLRAALAEYALAAAALAPAADAYERGGRMLNLLIKDCLLKRAARETELIASGASFDALRNDTALMALSEDGAELNYYVNGRNGGLYDQRNFPEFPKGDSYLGPKQYFAMGDNRYNSTDFRYCSESFSIRSLDPADPFSVQYYSDIDPFALDLRYIEGYALFRVWPPTRLGAIR
jgi:signal peptidase I